MEKSDLFKELGKALDPKHADKDFNQICDDLQKAEAIKCDRCGNETKDNFFLPGHYICTKCENSWQINPQTY